MRCLESLRVHHAALAGVHAHVASVLASVCHGCHHSVAEGGPWMFQGLCVWIRHSLHETALARVRDIHRGHHCIIFCFLVSVRISHVLL